MMLALQEGRLSTWNKFLWISWNRTRTRGRAFTAHSLLGFGISPWSNCTLQTWCMLASPTHPFWKNSWAGPWWLTGTRPVRYQDLRGEENGHFLPTSCPRCNPAVAHWYINRPLSAYHDRGQAEILGGNVHLPQSRISSINFTFSICAL